MTYITFDRKLTLSESIKYIPQIEEWFKKNPTKKICRTDNFNIRRGLVGTDVFNHTDFEK